MTIFQRQITNFNVMRITAYAVLIHSWATFVIGKNYSVGFRLTFRQKPELKL